MDGVPTDNNATLFAQGYDGVLKPYFDDGTYTKVDELAGELGQPAGADHVPAAVHGPPEHQRGGDAQRRPGQRRGRRPSRSANIPAKKVPTTGQDATLQGLQNILQGYQCMTVYKPIYLEAQAAVALAIYLRAGQTPPSALVNGTTLDTQSEQAGPVGAADPDLGERQEHGRDRDQGRVRLGLAAVRRGGPGACTGQTASPPSSQPGSGLGPASGAGVAGAPRRADDPADRPDRGSPVATGATSRGAPAADALEPVHRQAGSRRAGLLLDDARASTRTSVRSRR